MVWKKKEPLPENPINPEELKKYELPDVPQYEHPRAYPAPPKVRENKWELVEVPTQVQVVFRNNETNEDLTLHQAVCRILQIID